MTLSEALLKVLNNDEEPLKKRLKLADSAFKASEFHLHNKEALLLKWILNSANQLSNEQIWSHVLGWLSSREFRDLTQNDISNEDICAIIQLFENKLLDDNIAHIEKHNITESILNLCDNRVFQHYFKYNIPIFCNLISLLIARIDAPVKFVSVITKPFLFAKNYLVQEEFPKHFLNSLYPILVNKVLEFKNNQLVFDETVRLIQKCIFDGNTKQIRTFMDHVFNPETETKDDINQIKSLFKYLDNCRTATSFKLFYAALMDTLKEAELIFKSLIVLTKILQFEISHNFNIKLPFKQKAIMPLTKSLEIFSEVLGVVSVKGITDCTVSNMSLTEFLRNILKSLMFLKINSPEVMGIILKCILINPLVIEPIVSNLIIFLITTTNEEMKQSYEKVIIAIFEVFSKLHRVENFISKMIPALKIALDNKNPENQKEDIVYEFKGENDIVPTSYDNIFTVNMIFTDNILECFTKCLIGLASWQVINVFKTMLYHLKTAVEECGEENESNIFIFLETLGTLTTCLLLSVKIADHTIPQNVVAKFVKGQEELKDILKEIGTAILKREHNHITMRTFLNLSYTWAEVYITLSYYSMNNEVQMDTVTDSTYSVANLKYLHSYLDIKEWHLIAQRINNFGEQPCKQLMQKLYIQKLRAMLLLEQNLNEVIIVNLVKTLQIHMEDTWKDILLDKFTVGFILPKMDKVSLTFLAEHLIDNESLLEANHIKDSMALINACAYTLMSKINRVFKGKRKHDAGQVKCLSSLVFAQCPESLFFNKEETDITENIKSIMELQRSEQHSKSSSIASKEDKLKSYLILLKKIQFIYSDTKIQKLVFSYLMSLSADILECRVDVRKELEDLIIGTLQVCKYPLTDIFLIDLLGMQILRNFQRHDVIFGLVIDNVFKHEKAIMEFEPLVLHLVKNLEDSGVLSSTILVLQAINKVKKSKMNATTKETANQYKDKILTKMAKLVCKSEHLIEAYATCLKHYISIDIDPETLKKLLDKLGMYIEYSMENISNENKKGCAILFTTILQNKAKIKTIDNHIVLKIWNACQKVSIGEDYSHLVKLIVTLIPNEEFENLIMDLYDIVKINIRDQTYTRLVKHLKTWESILTCDVNAVKMKVWQEVLEKLIYDLLYVMKSDKYNEDLFKSVVHLEQSIIHNQHFIISPPLIDMFISSISVLMAHETPNFETVFQLSVQTMETLLKYRNAIIMDRLPAFLQQYRILLKSITSRSNSDESAVEKLDVKKASDCVHQMEKLTKNLVACKKDMGRIAVFLIADILEKYEQINLYPNVKLHLNNCIYSLISLCDHHAVSYLMRVLSSASTEMFKIMYDHYKKYYMFTGKV